MYPDDGFRDLGRQECLRLMAKVAVGRIVYTRRALPAVLPVNFSLDDDGAVLLRTYAASDLVRAVDGAVVAFSPPAWTDPASRYGPATSSYPAGPTTRRPSTGSASSSPDWATSTGWTSCRSTSSVLTSTTRSACPSPCATRPHRIGS